MKRTNRRPGARPVPRILPLEPLESRLFLDGDHGIEVRFDVGNDSVVIQNIDTSPSPDDGTLFPTTYRNAPTPPERTFKVVNTGTADLLIGGGGVIVQPLFSVIEPLDLTIPPGGSDTFTIRLDNTGADGQFDSEVIIFNNAENFSFSIHGEVLLANPSVPEIEVMNPTGTVFFGGSPDLANLTNLGTVALNSARPTRRFTVRNTGTADLTLGAISVPDGVELTEGLDAVLAPNASDTFTIRFLTNATGLTQGNVSFTSNDASEPIFIFGVRLVVGEPPELDLPASPTGLVATAPSSTQVTLTWVDAADDETGYRVYASTTEDGNYALADILPAGTTTTTFNHLTPSTAYFFRVVAVKGDNESVAVSASVTTPAAPVVQPPDRAGNTAAAARNLGALVGRRVFNDFITPVDKLDYYKFTLARPATVKIRLTDLSEDADINLTGKLASGAKFNKTATRAGSADDAIAMKLPAGGFVLRVLPGKAGIETPYKLTLIPETAGNTTRAARNLGAYAKSAVQDYVGDDDSDDVFKFTLAKSRSMTLALGALTADADLYLLNSKGKVLKKSEKVGRAAEKITVRLAAGTYFIRVSASATAANFKLALA